MMEAVLDRSRQVLEETGQDRKTRTTGDFHTIERSLPIVGSRFRISFLDSISSYLGQHNPFACSVKPGTESVWLLENTAYRPVRFFPLKPGPWQAEFVAAYFEKNTGKDVSKIVAQIAEKIGLGNDGEDKEQAQKTIAERLQPFIDTIAPARSVKVTLPTGIVHSLGPGGPSAVSAQIISNLGEHEDGDAVSTSAVPSEVTPYGPMTTHFAGPEGWAVISGMLYLRTDSSPQHCPWKDPTAHVLCRYRRHNQSHHDTISNRHSPFHLRLGSDPDRLDASALPAHRGHAQSDLVLPLSLALQPAPIPLLLRAPELSGGAHLPARGVVDGPGQLSRVAHAGHAGVQAQPDGENPRLAPAAQGALHRRQHPVRPGSLRRHVSPAPGLGARRLHPQGRRRGRDGRHGQE